MIMAVYMTSGKCGFGSVSDAAGDEVERMARTKPKSVKGACEEDR